MASVCDVVMNLYVIVEGAATDDGDVGPSLQVPYASLDVESAGSFVVNTVPVTEASVVHKSGVKFSIQH
jgi:hypothetical protein